MVSPGMLKQQCSSRGGSAGPVELVHGEQGVHMVGVLLQEGHHVVWVEARLALLKHHLNCLHTATNGDQGLALLL